MSKPEIPPLLAQLNPLGFWDLALQTLAKELSPQQFKTWIQPLKIKGYEESERLLLIGAPTHLSLIGFGELFPRVFTKLLQIILVTR